MSSSGTGPGRNLGDGMSRLWRGHLSVELRGRTHASETYELVLHPADEENAFFRESP